MKNINSKVRAYQTMIGFSIFFLVLAVSGVVVAFNESLAPKVVAQNGGTVIFNEALPPELPDEVAPSESLGAAATGIFSSKEECWNGGDCIFHFFGNLADATNTLVLIPTPFLKVSSTLNDVIIADADGTATTSQVLPFGYTGATSTVEMVRLNVKNTTGVNDNLTFACFSTPNGDGSTSTRSQYIIDTPANVTGTAYVIESGMVSSTYGGPEGTSAVVANGFIDAVSSTPYRNAIVQKIYLTPAAPWLACIVRAQRGLDIGLGGVTSTGNQFDGTFVVRISGQK